MRQVRKRLTYANVVATLALFLAIAGGTAFAATQLAKNSVGTKQLKKNAVTAAKIKGQAVAAGKIKDAAVGTAKLGDQAVTTSKLADDAVGNGKLAPEAVTTGKIAPAAVTGDKLAASALTGVVKEVEYVGKASVADSNPKTVTIDCGVNRKVIGAFYQAFDFGGEVKITVPIVRTATIAGEAERGLEVFASEVLADEDIWQLTASATCAELL